MYGEQLLLKRVGRACMSCNRTAANSKSHTAIEIGSRILVLCPKCRAALKVALTMDEIPMD
jgi:hypothetical protein